MKNVLLAINQPIIVRGTEIFLKNSYSNFAFLTTNDWTTTESFLAANDCHILIVGLSDIDFLCFRAVVAKYPLLSILIMSYQQDYVKSLEFYRIGVNGVFEMSDDFNKLLVAFEQSLARKTYMSEGFKRFLLNRKIPARIEVVPNLTKREAEIVTLMLKGLKISEISKALNLKITTISTFKVRIFTKLNINNILELRHFMNFKMVSKLSERQLPKTFISNKSPR